MMPTPRSSMKWRMFSGARPTKDLLDTAADFHGVVGDEAVAALNELDGGFAFTHAAVAHQQDALAVDLDEHAVAGDAGGQLHVEQGDQVRHHVGGGIPGGEQGNVIALRGGGSCSRRGRCPGPQ